MLGAIIGDIIGSVYEFSNTKDYNFPLFEGRSDYTDDSIMTVAVAEWLLNDESHSPELLSHIMRRYGREYRCPMGGYGSMFQGWLIHPEEGPYNSWGNGSAMRVSAVGWMFGTLEETERIAEISAAVSHNHPEGIKGAQATAAAIYLARTGKNKTEIKEYITSKFGYDLERSYSHLHATYTWGSGCQDTVPEAIIAFLESNSFEDSIRKAVALGGDSDTLTCINGGIAEAYYRDIPREMLVGAFCRLPESFKTILFRLQQKNPLLQYYKIERYSPDYINRLNENDVFVFGSNLEGNHNGGAARIAVDKFDAIMGQGVGMQGKCYAIPTMQGGVETIKPYVDEFIEFASQHQEKTFLVTRIGCGIARFKDSDIAPLFREALEIQNILLPRSFCDVLLNRTPLKETYINDSHSESILGKIARKLTSRK